MGKVIMSGIVPQLEAPTNYDPVFANNSWDQIIDACQKNKVPDTWAVGNQQAMTINGVIYIIDIIGKNHDTYSDGSGTAPLTFQMHYGYDELKQMNSTATNEGSWSASQMRTVHLPAILAKMPSEVQAGIKEVNKLTALNYWATTIQTTADKLFLLSEVEITSNIVNAPRGEGTQYEYYANNEQRRKKTKRDGSEFNWWERSPYRGYEDSFCRVDSNGNYTGSTASMNYGIAFAFCF